MIYLLKFPFELHPWLTLAFGERLRIFFYGVHISKLFTNIYLFFIISKKKDRIFEDVNGGSPRVERRLPGAPCIQYQKQFCLSTPGGIQTPNHLIRSEACYSVTLRGHRCWNPENQRYRLSFPRQLIGLWTVGYIPAGD